MTDDDFDNKDDDFASEFDFVDSKNATPSTANIPASPGSSGGSKQNSPKVVMLLLLISVLGGGYYAYSHFFSGGSKPPEMPKSPTELPHGQHALPPAAQTNVEATSQMAGHEIPPAAPTNTMSELVRTKPFAESITATFPKSPTVSPSVTVIIWPLLDFNHARPGIIACTE